MKSVPSGNGSLRHSFTCFSRILVLSTVCLASVDVRAQSFTFTGPLTIPDGSCSNGYEDVGEGSSVTVAGVGMLNGTTVRIDSVRVNITMTWNSDLNIWLESPSGAILELSTGNGGSGDNYTNTVFQDNAPAFVTTGSAPFTGSFRPEGRNNILSNAPSDVPATGTYTFANTFNGTNANGAWKLRICDNTGSDVGSIQNWTIYFSGCSFTQNNDAGISALSNPAIPFSSGSNPVTVTLKNFGNQVLTSTLINWSINGAQQNPFSWTGNLFSNATDIVTLGNINFLPGIPYNIKVWPSQANNQNDQCSTNDTLRVNNLYAALSGTYTIGGANPDFATFNQAMTVLNNSGVIGPVIFNVRNGVYAEQINVYPVAGASASNTITFQSESGDSTAVVLQFNSPNVTQNYVVRMLGGDWFRFRKMTFKALNSNFAQVVNFAGAADNNIFENNQFIGVVTTSISSDFALVFSPSATVDNGNIFKNNYFKDGSDGIWLNGATSEYENGTVVKNNRFENQYRRTINLAYQNASIISENNITSNTTYPSYYSIVAYFCKGGQQLTKNKINLNSAVGGIVVEECVGLPAERGLVANNFVQIAGALQISGIYFFNATYQNCYFNSVYTSSSNIASRPFVLSGGGNLRLFNNIGYNSTTGLALWRNSLTNIEASNYNDFITAGADLAYNSVNAVYYPNLTAWKTATGFDLNSLSVNPQFFSATDLHTTNIQLEGKAIPFPEVTTDIDGQSRSVATPDIGADEFVSFSRDAVAVKFVELTAPVPAGSRAVKLLLRNEGSGILNSAQINLQVNNNTPVPTNWSGNLVPGDSVVVTLNTINLAANQSYTLTAWSALPNGLADQNPENDTIRFETQGLVGYYSFCGCTSDDDSGLGNHATLVGAPSCASGRLGNGYLLNAAEGGNNGCGQAGGQYIKLPPTGPIWQEGFTVSAWVRFDNASSYERIIDIGNGSGDLGGLPVWFGRQSTTNNLMIESWISSDGNVNHSTGQLITSNAIVNGIFQHYCATLGPGNIMRIYVNGELKAEKVGHSILNVPRNGNFIGHSSWCSNDPDLRGLVDEVRLYNRALSPTEINGLYQNFADYNKTVCAGTPVQLEAKGGVSYQWSPAQFLNNPNIANPIATPNSSITYQCAITQLDGCSQTDTVRISVLTGTPLQGTYTIGGSSPNFPTFTAAINALFNQGVCGPVVFKVRNGTYNEQLTIQPIPGATAYNNIRFESESGDSSLVILTFTSAVSTTPWTLRILGADYITFRKMTIEANGGTYAQAVQLADGAQYNSFLNNILRSGSTTSTSSNRALVFCGAGENKNMTFRKNRFLNGSTGLWFEGNSNNGAYIADIRVDSNQFVNQYERAAYLSFVKRAKIRANTMASTSTSTGYIGLRILNGLDSNEVTANRIAISSANAYGIRLENINSTVLAPALIANNFVELNGNTSRQGIYSSGNSYLNFFYNTVRISNTNVDSRALEINSNTNVVVRNNILSNTGGGYAIYKSAGTITSNYNDLHSSGGRTGFWEGSVVATLAAWRTASSGQDLNSIAVDPLFAVSGYYRPRVSELNGTGSPTNLVTKDIDGSPRNAQSPDMGVDEFNLDALDASVVGLTGLALPVSAGQRPIGVLLKNNGVNTLSSVQISLRVNNNAPLVTNWSGNLESGDTILVNLNTVNLTAGQSYNLYAWSALPNGGTDLYINNDTTKVLNILPALNGIYTIGGAAPDFLNFADAANALTAAGVIGPTTFNVRNGTYNEIITIGQIPGVDASKQVVFQSESGDSSLVILTFSATSSTAPWTLRLNGADYCTFRKMTIEANGTSFAQAVQLVGDAQNNRFFNNVLRSTTTTSTSSNRAVVFCSTGDNKNAVFRKNRFVNGSTGLWFEGNVNGGSYIDNIRVDSNQFVNQYERASYLSYVKRAKIRANTMTSLSTGENYIGLRILNSLDSTEVSANRMSIASVNAYGIRLENMTGTVSAPALVANNFVEINGNVTRQGIYSSASVYTYFLNNTVRVSNTHENSRALELSNNTNVFIRNNILSNTGGGYAIYKNNGTLLSNYNDLYSSGNRTGYWDGTTSATLTAWQTISSGQDLNSLAVNPEFAGSGAYLPRNIELNNAGIPNATVTRDIDGELRDLQHPDIGVDEFIPVSLDASAVAFIGLVAPVPGGSTPIQITLKNNGATTLTSVNVYLRVNNDSPVLTNWTGTLVSGATTPVDLGTLNLTGGQVYNLTAWTNLPNGSPDQYFANDTTRRLGLIPALSGIYTIGGTAADFANFTAAANALTQAGVSGPVTFNVRNGTYTEQISLAEILGVNSTRPVIFQSESGDSSQVILRFNASSTANYTVRLNGTDWIAFRSMTIEAQNATYNRVVSIEEGANEVTLSNNVLLGVNNNSITVNRALVYVSGTITNNNLRVLNNRMLNGAYAIYYPGPSTNAIYATGTIISGNRMEGQYAYGVYLNYNKDVIVQKNTITTTAYYSAFEGIRINEAYNSPQIKENKILSTSDGYGIYLSSVIGTVANPAIVANNFVQLGSNTSINYGIYCIGNQVKVLYNTVRVYGTNVSGSALYMTIGNPYQAVNNVFANFGGGYASRLSSSAAANQIMDYNDLYTSGSILVFTGTSYSDLTAWKNSGLGFDEHSVSVNPLFYANNDYRVAQTDLNGAGTPNTFVATDIEGDARNNSTPDIGADEFSPAASDAGIAQVISPATPFAAGQQPILAVLKNQGSSPLTSAHIDWTVTEFQNANSSVTWTKAFPANLLNYGTEGGLQATNLVGWQNGAEAPAINGDFVLEYKIDVLTIGSGVGDCMFGYAKINPDPTQILALSGNGKLLYLDQGSNIYDYGSAWLNSPANIASTNGNLITFTITRVGGLITYSITGGNPTKSGTIEAAFSGPLYPVAVFYNNGCRLRSATLSAGQIMVQPQPSILWTGNLASGASQTVALGNANFTIGRPTFIKVWASAPNTVPDPVAVNDTSSTGNLYPALNGVYTIGGTSPDFTNFTQAINAIHNGGVLGPVMFNVRNGIYPEQLSINQVLGASQANTITFQSESGDSTAVALQFNANSTSNYTVQLNGADWIRFKKMTLQALNTTNARVVDMSGGANNNVFENNRFLGVVTTSTLDSRAIIYSSGIKDNGTVFRRNYFLNGSYGFYFVGASGASNHEEGTVIENNRFENQYRVGLYLLYQNAPIVSGNIISSTTTYTAYYGIWMNVCTNNQRITGNKLTLNNAAIGINIDNSSGAVANRGLIANNFVQIGGTLSTIGIYFNNSTTYQNAYFNSIHINSTNVNSRCFDLNSGSNIRLFNNIGYNSTNGYVLQRSSTTIIEASNRNNFFTTGANLVFNSNNTTYHTTLTAWQTATGFDLNSLSTNPQFVSATDLHTTNVLLDAKGTPFAEVPTDIDGQFRNTTTPDIGADEFSTAPDEAGVVSVDYPKKAFAAGTQPVIVSLVNNGLDTLEFVEIAWTLNGVAQPPYFWTGTLLSGAVLPSVTIGTAIFEVNTPYAIKAWTRLPNGMADPDMSNDSALVSNLYAALGGNYTLGGTNPDFPTFASAVNALARGGVVDSVFFNVRNGVYTEQIKLKEVFGAGADKHITFQSESGDSTAVKLTFNSNSTNNYTVRLDSADWFRFRRMTLEATNGTYGRVVHLLNGAEQSRFENCVFQGVLTGISSTDLVYSETTSDNFTTFTNNRFEGGYTGVNLSGNINNETGLIIQGNIFNSQNYSPIFLNYQSNPVIQRNTITQIISNTATYGIYLYQCSNGYRIIGNKIRLRRSYGIYIDRSDTPVGIVGLVANNFVSVGEGLGNQVYGIYIYDSDRARIYYNSINANSSSTSTNALYNISNNGLELKNNIFACPLGSVPIQCNGITNLSSNYNDFFTTGNQLGVLENATIATLSDWQAASGQDANSRSINPQFVSNTDLHIEEVDLNGSGTPVAGITDDIDGELRSPTTPDIGADEFAPISIHDASVEYLIEPNKLAPFPSGLRNVVAVLKNNGADTLMTTTVQWRVNNLPKTPYSWSGVLYPGQRDTVIIGTHNFAVGVDHDLTAYTQNPNGFPDSNTANDTAKINDLYAALNGVYTIGGVVPNFASFSAAVTSLIKGGVLGPVTFNVRNGTYNESLTLTNIKGSSVANTVTFQSESGDSSLVTLMYTGGGTVFRLDNADNLIFRKMTFSRANNDIFYLENGVNNVQILNNRFVETTTNSYHFIQGEGSSVNDSDIKVINNRFEGGYYAIQLSAYNTNVLENGTVIQGNEFIETRYYAIYLSYQNAPVIHNNVINTSLSAIGVECYYCNNDVRVTNNKITIGQDNRGIRLRYCSGTPTNRGLIANNFVSIGGSNFAIGISSYAGSYQNIFHNTVHLHNTSASSRSVELINGGNDKNLLNNVFANTGGGYAYYFDGNGTIQVSNFNDLYSTGTNLAYWSGTNVANLTALRNISSREQNSVSANPLFYSPTDLHVLQVALDSAASYTPTVTVDIDGQTRNVSYPDIGADEFNYLTKDVGIVRLLTPVEGCELGAAAKIKVVIQNYGGLPQTGFDVAYKRGYGTTVVENIGARTVQPGDTIHYTFTETVNVSAYQSHMFTLYSKLTGDLNLPNDTVVTFITNFQTPAAVGNMLPANGTLNVSPPVTFSWLPAAGATRYDIYIWKADQAQPTTPTGQDLTQISYYYNPTGLVYGAAYKWRIVSKNNYCSTAGPIQQFTLRELPDLTVGSVMAPAQPFSGTMISVSWTTTNNGSGATGMSQWYEYVYLSTDPVYQAGADLYLGGASNLTALNPGQGYSQMANVTLPTGIQGNYYLIVLTDINGNIGESNENNNTSIAFPIVVNLTPPPDLKVTSITAPTSAFSGQTINISFTVKNQGTGDVPPGNAFQDYVYLSPTPTLNLNTATTLKIYYANPITTGASQTRMVTAELPLAIFGTYYIHVYTDRHNQVFEFAFEDNNISVSNALTIFLTPPPDLVVSQVSAPSFVSNNQSVTVQWTDENQGATTAAGSWYDRVYISRRAIYHPDSVTSVGVFFNAGNLPAGESSLRTGTVTIPGNITGPYYFFVHTDFYNAIFEYTSENNNITRSNGTTTVLNADLVVPQTIVPTTASSGNTLLVDWTVKNEGLGSVLNVNRTDNIYLSQNPVLDIPTSTLVGSLSYSGSLLSGQSVAKQTTVTIPNGIFGPYFVHVVTDAGNTIFENQQENNNTNKDTVQIMLSPWPDLEPLSMSALPDTLQAGQTLSFLYSVKNTGTGPMPGGNAWKDKVYISVNPVFTANATLLSTLDLLQGLSLNEVYSKTTSLNIPLVSANTYYFYVVTDPDNQVYEYTDEGNNILRSGPVYIRTPEPVDFETIMTSKLPDTLYSGALATLTWCIRNNGSSTAVFDFQLWYDGIYLSPDSIWDEYDDIFVKDFTKNGPVDSLEMYNNTQSFNMPNGISGNYYVFLVADHNERTNDEHFDDNPRLVRPVSYPTGPAKPIYFKLTPSPDLEASNFLSPTNGISGQPVQVIWTVKNNGPGTTAGSWTDKVYLSTNFTIDGSDAIIGTKSQARVLAPGQMYTDTLEVFLPISASGNYILIFKTDANNTLYEFNAEANNTFFSYITATQPAPSDLIVNDISFVPMAMVGEPFTVTWSIKNQGANPSSGVLRELIYFSVDSMFDASDIPLSASIQRSINLSPNASASKSFTARTPGLPLGNYFVIVATDVLDNILESDEGNNQRIAVSKVMVTVKELPIGILTPDSLENNTPLYYRIEVPPNLNDETLLLTLDGLTTGSVNELYLSHCQVPTRSTHDFAFGNPNQPDQSILVPELDSGTYYLLVYGATDFQPALGKQDIRLKAEIINFQIISVMSAQGGNTGNVTIRVDGAKFSPNMTLKLTDASLGTRMATKIIYVNSTRVFATFNLAGMALGVYDVVATKQAEMATLADGFTVVAGDAGTTNSGDGSSGFFCTIVNIGTDQNLSKNILHPAAVRVNRLVPITIQFGNAGNVDIPAPARFLLSLRGAPLAFSPDDLEDMKQELFLAFQEIGGPPGILRPGSFSSITVYSYSSHPLSFILRE